MRRWLLAEDLWSRKRQSSEYRSRRGRRESFGELIQFDVSPTKLVRHHRWFEERGLKCCLITLIDDATNTRLSHFFEEETTAGAMTVLSLWIRKYGIPQALYCDKKNAFVLTREPTDAELLKGITKPVKPFREILRETGHRRDSRQQPASKRAGRAQSCP